MREIKFRQFIKDNSDKRLWHYWGFIDGAFISPQNNQDKSQQFTGLKDKNGKEIYEGDIVEWKIENPLSRTGKMKTKCVVEWNLNNQGWIPYINITSEVIGNIYENPELLK